MDNTDNKIPGVDYDEIFAGDCETLQLLIENVIAASKKTSLKISDEFRQAMEKAKKTALDVVSQMKREENTLGAIPDEEVSRPEEEHKLTPEFEYIPECEMPIVQPKEEAKLFVPAINFFEKAVNPSVFSDSPRDHKQREERISFWRSEKAAIRKLKSEGTKPFNSVNSQPRGR